MAVPLHPKWVNSLLEFTFGEMAEWSIAAVLKTVEANYLQGFESLSLRIFLPVYEAITGWSCSSVG